MKIDSIKCRFLNLGYLTQNDFCHYTSTKETTMTPAKQEALDTIGQLPYATDLDEMMYRLYVLDKVRKGQQALEQG